MKSEYELDRITPGCSTGCYPSLNLNGISMDKRTETEDTVTTVIDKQRFISVDMQVAGKPSKMKELRKKLVALHLEYGGIIKISS